MNDTHPATDQPDLAALLRPLLRRWWLVLGIVVVATAGAYYVDARKAKVYEASTSVFVNTAESPVTQFETGQFAGGSSNTVADLALLAQSTAVGEQMKKALGSPESPAGLLAKVNASPDPNADFIDIYARGSSPAGAAALANAFAQSFLTVGHQQDTEQLDQLAAATSDQLNALSGSGSAVASQRQQLQTRLRAITDAAANLPGPEQQLDPAAAPASPISPDPKKIAAIALAVALVNALILVYLLELVDRRIRNVDDLASAYELPLLGLVPHVSNPALIEHGRAGLDGDLLEALRFLRINLSLQALDRPIKLLLVTSAVPGEGKSTVVRNLALAYREAGTNVVAVDADLRRPTLAASVGVTGPAPGLTSVLLGDSEVSDAIVKAEADLPGLPHSRHEEFAAPSVSVIPSGGPAVNPPAILGSARMAEVLHELATTHDLVIIDSPPLLAVSDTLPLLSIVDGVILVARVNTTTRDALKRVKAALRASSTARVLGVVAEDVKKSPSYNYGYDYSYDSNGNGAAPAAPARESARLPS
jgi:capsular exopolysaccharide synthesis family protein